MIRVNYEVGPAHDRIATVRRERRYARRGCGPSCVYIVDVYRVETCTTSDRAEAVAIAREINARHRGSGK